MKISSPTIPLALTAAVVGATLLIGGPAQAASNSEVTEPADGVSPSCLNATPGLPAASTFAHGDFSSIDFTLPTAAGGPVKVVLRDVPARFNPATPDSSADPRGDLRVNPETDSTEAVVSWSGSGSRQTVTYSFANSPTSGCLQLTKFHTDMYATYWFKPFVVEGGASAGGLTTFKGGYTAPKTPSKTPTSGATPGKPLTVVTPNLGIGANEDGKSGALAVGAVGAMSAGALALGTRRALKRKG